MVIIAHQTMQAINDKMFADQGAVFRSHLKKLIALADDAYSTDTFPFRSHLGASGIGEDCARKVWYAWHWSKEVKHDARIIRLFNRGHLEEPRMMALLMMIGCEVWQLDTNGKQYKITGHSGHYGGSLDGVALGIPEFPDLPGLVEFKTHSDKSFNEVKGKSVLLSKPTHFQQMQQYMGYHKLSFGLYMAVNKNTDEIYAEIIMFNKLYYDKYFERAGKIIESKVPPDKISKNSKFYTCTYCDFKSICHGKDLPARNCRTCLHSEAYAGNNNGEWHCVNPLNITVKRNPIVLTKEEQFAGCDNYEVNPYIKEAL